LALAIQMAGLAEAAALGVRLGLQPELLSQVFNSSSARCWSSETYNPVPVTSLPPPPPTSERARARTHARTMRERWREERRGKREKERERERGGGR
jgi:3-hydroxyisobutyrate dehydrogenase-like beta-hydroxyacid dehydrogenase